MSDTICGYEGKRDETIVAYLYGELAVPERTVFTRHLTRCVICQREIDALGDLRRDLAAWAAPDAPAGKGMINPASAGPQPLRPAVRSLRIVEPLESPASPPPAAVNSPEQPRNRWRDMPAWAQFAAAMLVASVGAGIANLQITYDRNGVVIRTGWSEPAPMAPAAAAASAPAGVTQADLDALASQLRSELQAAPPAAAPVALSRDEQDAIVQRVRAMVKESEQRQQRELALRMAEMAQDAQAQRQADLVRIDRTLGMLQSTTGTAVRRQEQLLNNLAVRVSQRQ